MWDGDLRVEVKNGGTAFRCGLTWGRGGGVEMRYVYVCSLGNLAGGLAGG